MNRSILSRLAVAGALVAVGAAFSAQWLPTATASTTNVPSAQDMSLPASATTVASRLAKSTRHGEFIKYDAGKGDSVNAYVVFPERSTKAPVVVVVHEIYGLSTWVRGVADQLAADGFIAIAPDFLSGTGVTGSDSVLQANGPAAIRTLKREDVQRRISGAAHYGMKLPAATQKYGVVGYCWGGSTVFTHAVDAPGVSGVVVYYGTSPASSELASIKAPVLGLYGGNDARVNSTIPGADSTMKSLKKRYEQDVFPGAGHGFLRQQEGADGANMEATKKAWPRTIAFFRETLGR